MQQVPPSITRTSFNCPHCGAFAQQNWYSLLASSRFPGGRQIPKIALEGAPPFFGEVRGGSFVDLNDLLNMFVSHCFSCRGISIWVDDKLVYPQRGNVPPANPDLSDDIRRDYDEASRILGPSPRGAAALMRLAIQKLCKELGESGENINADIRALVAKGLDSRIQKALDVVRVIGNNAVHPGQLDLRDDGATAESLFSLLNLIVEKMISEPKRVDEVYAKLPKETRQAIEKRDGRNGTFKTTTEDDEV